MSELFTTFPGIDFRPHPLFRSGHAQTWLASWWTGELQQYGAREVLVQTTCGDQLVLHDDQPTEWRDGDPVTLLIHGLGGCHRSPYMVRIAAKLNARGVRTFRMDMRGCGTGSQLARQPGHAGRSEDVAAAVAQLKAICPQSPRIAVGFSLGGNLLLKWLGESGDDARHGVDRALAVSTPVDLALCARNLQRRERRLYDRFFVRALLRQIPQLRGHFSGLADIDLSRPPRTLYEFDDRVTAPLSGFSGAEEYYRRCSAAPLLGAIQTPTVLLSALDDPLIPCDMYQALSPSKAVAIRLLQHGGHVGFFGRGGRDPDWHWMDWRVADFVKPIV
jgi:predicted alpha/beta-fold hydrolase